MSEEWYPDYPDWMKETRCTPCRLPSEGVGVYDDRKYTPRKCRDCRFAKISKCSDCGKDIRHCLRRPQNGPPDLNVDGERWCVLWMSN